MSHVSFLSQLAKARHVIFTPSIAACQARTARDAIVIAYADIMAD
jgi:hypothetical protein